MDFTECGRLLGEGTKEGGWLSNRKYVERILACLAAQAAGARKHSLIDI